MELVALADAHQALLIACGRSFSSESDLMLQEVLEGFKLSRPDRKGKVPGG